MENLMKDLTRNFRKSMIARAAAIIFTDMMEILFALRLGAMLSGILEGNAAGKAETVQFCMLFLAIIVIGPCLLFYSNKLILKESVAGDELLFKQFLSQNPSKIIRCDAGEVSAKLQEDGIELRWSVIDRFVYVSEFIVSGIVFLFLSVSSNFWYTAVVGALVILNWCKAKIAGTACAKSNAAALDRQQKFEHCIMQAASVIDLISVNKLGNVFVKKLKKPNEELTQNGLIPKKKMSAVNETISFLYENMAYLIVLLAGLFFCRAGVIEMGTVLTMSLYYGILSGQFSNIDDIIRAGAMGKEMLEDIEKILDEPKELISSTFRGLSISPFVFDLGEKKIYQWESDSPSDIASGVIAEACKGMLPEEPVHASQRECRSILEYRKQIRIKPKDRVAIVGANGSGKTTLLYVILGLLQENGGKIKNRDTVKVNGENRDVGVMKGMTDYVDVNAELFDDRIHNYLMRNCSQKKAPELIEELNLRPVLDKTGDCVSGGERKRVDAARVLANGKDIIALDEPEEFLDVFWKQEIIRKLKDYPGTLIYTTHDKDFIDLADVVIDLTASDELQKQTHQIFS